MNNRGDNKMNNISENLQILRNKIGKSQFLIASELNIAQPTYSSYETGTREPNIETLIKLADFYNVSLDKLIRKDS